MRVQCCFCGETIEGGDESLSLSLPTREAEAEQVVWCHGACLSQAVHPSVPVLHDEVNRILVPLHGEGVPVFRPAQARKIGEDLYQIAAGEPVRIDENWAFPPGATVRCELRRFSDGSVGLVALALGG